jgi:hypothetical protein
MWLLEIEIRNKALVSGPRPCVISISETTDTYTRALRLGLKIAQRRVLEFDLGIAAIPEREPVIQ